MRVKDFMLALVIFILFGVLFFVAVLATGLKEIKKNWPKYKCNPSIMPFAGQFGHNTMQNFTECIGGIQMNLMGFFLQPLYSIIKTISSLGTKLLGSIQSIRKMLSWMRFSVFELVKDILAMFVNIVSRFSVFCFKKASTPVTINKAKNENMIKFNIKLKFPLFNSLSFFT